MRILWWSNAPWAYTGYGRQTRETTTRLRDAGHEVAILANFGLQGSSITWNGMTIYPSRSHPLGTDVLRTACQHFGADLVISLYDVWAFPMPDTRDAIPCPWLALIPVDGAPIPYKTFERAVMCDYPAAFSEFGRHELFEAGLDPLYIPHGIDCEAFKPGDKAESRAELGIPGDMYLVTMVAANKGFPSRKAFREAFAAFAKFRGQHDEARLYVHSTVEPFPDGVGGEFLHSLAREYDIARAVSFADRDALAVGIPDEQMALIYQASDVLLHPSMGEGFGLPIAEAQACGCPVVTQDCSAMTELTVNGVACPPLRSTSNGARDARLVYNWQLPDVDMVAAALEQIYQRTDEEREGKAHFGLEFIRKNYDWPRIIERRWTLALERIEREIEASSACSHVWPSIGIVGNGFLRVPCTRPECPAQVVIAPDGSKRGMVAGYRSDAFKDLDIVGHERGNVVKLVQYEVVHWYGLSDLDLLPGQVVVDVGAHVGVVSVYLAKRYGVRVLAYEPNPASFELLQRNVEANGVNDLVSCVPLAVSGDGAEVTLYEHPAANSGGVSAFWPDAHEVATARSVTLTQAFEDHGIDRAALLKVDCEGGEYGILQSCDGLLTRVDVLAAEIHTGPGMERGQADALAAYCREQVADCRIIMGTM